MLIEQALHFTKKRNSDMVKVNLGENKKRFQRLEENQSIVPEGFSSCRALAFLALEEKNAAQDCRILQLI